MFDTIRTMQVLRKLVVAHLVLALVPGCAAASKQPSSRSAPPSALDEGHGATGVDEPGERKSDRSHEGGSSTNVEVTAGFQPRWNRTTEIRGFPPLPLGPEEVDEAAPELNEKEQWTGRVVHDGVVVAAKLHHCEGLLDDPPPAVALDVRADDIEYGPDAKDNFACLKALAEKTRVGLYMTDDQPPPVPEGMEMLVMAWVIDLTAQTKLRHLEVLELSRLDGIRGLTQLEYLRAQEIDRAEALGTLAGLRWLDVRPRAPGQLAHVRGLKELEHVDVAGGYLDQADLEAVADLPALRWLSLRRAGGETALRVDVLIKATRLRYVDLRETHVDADSLKRLQEHAARSELTIVR